MIFLSTCSPDIHEVNFEKGEWINIKNANNKNGYCIIGEQHNVTTALLHNSHEIT